jgi:hypothetical protein
LYRKAAIYNHCFMWNSYNVPFQGIVGIVWTNGGGMASFVGTGASDELLGTPDADVISGLGGDDTISGAGGADQLFGNDGNDRFVFMSQQSILLPNSFAIPVVDGGDGTDRIELLFGSFDFRTATLNNIEAIHIASTVRDLTIAAGQQQLVDIMKRDNISSFPFGGPLLGGFYLENGTLEYSQKLKVLSLGFVQVTDNSGTMLGNDVPPPVLAQPLADQTATKHSLSARYVFSFNKDAFQAPAAGLPLLFSVSLADGSSLPSGLLWQSDSGFSGDASLSGFLDIKVTAYFGPASVSDVFRVTFAPLPPLPTGPVLPLPPAPVGPLVPFPSMVSGTSGPDYGSLSNGKDNFKAGAGADHVLGRKGDDRIKGQGGNDWLFGESGNDRLYGGEDDDFLEGGKGKDKLFGNSGSDRLDGGAGSDMLEGGKGKDIFVFNDLKSRDRIVDYSVKNDTIWLSTSVFNFLSVGPLPENVFKVVGDGVGKVDSDDRVIYNAAKGTLAYDRDGSGKGAAFVFATLDKGLKMTVSEFSIWI